MEAEMCCVFCADKSKKITPFTKKTLSKCKQVMEVRKKLKLKYSGVKLPVNSSKNKGYHQRCFKYFNTVPKMFINKYEDGMSVEPEPNPIEEVYIDESSEIVTPDITNTDLFETEFESKDNIQIRISAIKTEKDPILNIDQTEISLTQPKVEKETYEEGSVFEMFKSEEESDQDIKMKNESIDIEDNIAISKTESIRNYSEFESDKNVDGKESSTQQSCFFCNKYEYTTLEGETLALNLGSKSVLELTLQPFKTFLEHSEFDRKLQCLGSTYYYHKKCYGQYINNLIAENCDKSKAVKRRDLHEKCTKYIFKFVLENVINKGKCYYVKTLNNHYTQHMQKVMEKEFGIECSADCDQNELVKKILNNFPNEIKFQQLKKMRFIMPKDKTITPTMDIL